MHHQPRTRLLGKTDADRGDLARPAARTPTNSLPIPSNSLAEHASTAGPGNPSSATRPRALPHSVESTSSEKSPALSGGLKAHSACGLVPSTTTTAAPCSFVVRMPGALAFGAEVSGGHSESSVGSSGAEKSQNSASRAAAGAATELAALGDADGAPRCTAGLSATLAAGRRNAAPNGQAPGGALRECASAFSSHSRCRTAQASRRGASSSISGENFAIRPRFRRRRYRPGADWVRPGALQSMSIDISAGDEITGLATPDVVSAAAGGCGARRGRCPTSSPWQSRALEPHELVELVSAAGRRRDRHWQKRTTFSPKVFLPLTNLCRNHCDYCSFRRSPGEAGEWTMTPDEVVLELERARARHCTEALLCLGDKPETAFRSYRETLRAFGHESTVDYLEWAAMQALERGLLPHTNAGVLDYDDMRRLRRSTSASG